MGINKKGAPEGCRRKNGRFARRVKAAPQAFIFPLADAQKDLLIAAAGEDPDRRAKGTFFRRSLHPHQKRNKGGTDGDRPNHSDDYSQSAVVDRATPARGCQLHIPTQKQGTVLEPISIRT